MKILLFQFLFVIPILSAINTNSQDVIFLHHSTGENVYYEGNVEAWIDNYNSQHSTNYNITENSYPDDPYPWENYPYDYWNLWLNGVCDDADPDIACLSGLCANYNVIIFKHCYPGSAIRADDGSPSISSSKKTLANYKLQYNALRDLMDTYPDNKFIVWTLAPLHRLSTNTESAARARQFVDWVKNEWLTEDGKEHPNIYVFDFFGYVAESDPDPEYGEVNCLKYDFERSHDDNNSHPNTLANETAGPIFAEFIVNTIEDIRQINVIAITITETGGATTIATDGGTLQLSATIVPSHATNNSVTWSIQNGTGQATITSSGLVTAIADGTVTAKATANDGSGVSGSLGITISGQTIAVTGITVTGAGGATNISSIGGTLQLFASVTPDNATNKAVTWSIQNETGQASISTTGLVTAIANGSVTAKATANDGSGVNGSLTITISVASVAITNIIIYGEDFKTSISAPGGSLQLHTAIFPTDATNKSVTWSVQNGTGQASISSDGLLTTIANGNVTVKATAKDGSGVSGILIITIENQNLATDLEVSDLLPPFLTISPTGVIIHLDENMIYSNCCIYNITGNLLINQKLSDVVNYIDISSIHPGIYIIVLTGHNTIKEIKFAIP